MEFEQIIVDYIKTLIKEKFLLQKHSFAACHLHQPHFAFTFVIYTVTFSPACLPAKKTPGKQTKR